MSYLKKNYWFERIICFILFMIITMMVSYFLKFERNRTQIYHSDRVNELSDGWFVNGNNDKEVGWPNKVLLNKDDTLRASRIINKNFIKNNSTLCLETYYCDINVYINDEKYYTYESYKDGIGKTDGKVVILIDLPSDLNEDSTYKLTIEYIPQFELNDVYTIKNPVAGDRDSLLRHYYKKGFFHSCIVFTFIFIGLGLIFMYFLFMRKITNDLETFNLGLFSIISGVYLICHNKWSYLVISNQKILYITEFLSLSLIGMPLLFIMYRFNKTRAKNFFLVAIILNLVSFIGQVTAYCLGLREFRTMLGYTHIVLFVSGIIAVITIIKDKESDVLKKLVIALVIGGLAETAVFYTKIMKVGYCLKISILVFVVVQSIYQIKKYRTIYDKIRKNEIYKSLAYLDILTGINNRNCYEKDVSIINRDINSYETIRCAVVDLNGLKMVNDNYGHGAGDELIKSFGHILRKSLDEKNKPYRIGGDEFVIIFPNVTKEKVEKQVMKISQNVDEYNKNSKIKISYALGVAQYKKLKHKTIMDVILEADVKMYRDKVASKEGARSV